MTTSQCLEILGVEQPKISGRTQREVDEKLDKWKRDVLRPAYRSRCKEVHPDKSQDHDGQAFKEVKEAYQKLRQLKVNLRRPSQDTWDKDAIRCPHGHERIPRSAKFCHECGYSYRMIPSLEKRLLERGITRENIKRLKETGVYVKLERLSPLSKELQTEIEILVQRQRLGFIGKHSPWR